ncbi:2-hydroxychromene-2-carboxylate isomerase [Chelativorans sp.]|uniref:2-hydroxychromene-2-carboxylate isomerase n=1 Tax=Chelativorans sp. TaxID=2203393 RepID=UPI0028120747|nr:2-hydroxychromene-2-carboxylate isomerase [Chelativorans sp.]
MKPPIEFFFDPISPFSYLATTRIDEIAAHHGRAIDWRPTLIGITTLKVMGLKPVPETPLKSVYFWHDVQRLASMFGVPLNRHGLSGINSLAACRAFLWLKDRDPEAASQLIRHLSARLWTDALDITPPETVIKEAQRLGIVTTGMEEALGSRELKQRLHDAVQYAISRNVFGVPFFIADGEPLWGCDRLWMLDHWLEKGEWPRL